MPVSLFRHAMRRLLPVALILGLAACSFPGVYKLDVQQGNIVSQEMVNQLKPGMTKRQVRYIMGTPLLVDTFHEDRWDYIYSLKNHDDEYSRERLTLIFANDQLVNLQGNFRPEQSRTAAATARPAQSKPVDTMESRERQSNVQVYPIDTPAAPQSVPTADTTPQ